MLLGCSGSGRFGPPATRGCYGQSPFNPDRWCHTLVQKPPVPTVTYREASRPFLPGCNAAAENRMTYGGLGKGLASLSQGRAMVTESRPKPNDVVLVMALPTSERVDGGRAGGGRVLKVAVLTRRGSGREINQDRVVVNDMVVDSDQATTALFTVEHPCLLAVLDGLGGHPAGDVASSLAAEVIASGSSRVETESDVVSLVEKANRFLYDTMLAHKGLRDMGTTIAGALITADGAVVFWVGDSRVYLHSGGYLTQVTVDDWEAGYITQTLGGFPWFHPIQVHTTAIPFHGGRILAATDGLFGRTNPAILSRAMRGPLEDVPDRLSEVAMRSGNTDDFSVAVVEPTELERSGNNPEGQQ